MEISKHKNSQVLPLIKPYTGLRLPPDRYCLSAPNYKMTTHKAVKKVNFTTLLLEYEFYSFVFMTVVLTRNEPSCNDDNDDFQHQARIQIGIPQFQQRINLSQMSMTPGGYIS